MNHLAILLLAVLPGTFSVPPAPPVQTRQVIFETNYLIRLSRANDVNTAQQQITTNQPRRRGIFRR